MSTIQDTVATALGNAGLGGYSQQARPVVDALVQREQQIVGQIIASAGSEYDIDEDDLRDTFEGLGLALPPRAEDVLAQPVAGGDRVAQLEAQVAALTQIARNNGLLR